MQSSKGKFWKRRGGSSRMSLMSSGSQDSKQLVDVEEEFLHAAEFGDIPTVRRLLVENSELNIDCIDALGRTALRLAVKNEHLEVVEVLLDKSSSRHIYEAVLQAISAGHVQIAESILKHKRYLELWKERKRLGDDDHFFKTQFEESQFSPDITPLILASQKNQYEIVQLLLLRGETIQKPHKYGCVCQECTNKMKFDQLRSAKYRLNAYRGLSSEAYISLSSKDPILTAFQLTKELKNLSKDEKYFKLEYKELTNQLSEYVVKLLDRVRTQEELEMVLNKAGKPNQEKYFTLARLKLALQFEEKRFVAHPSCQQRIDQSWNEGIGYFKKSGIFKRVLLAFLFIIVYPFLILVYLAFPDAKWRIIRILKYAWVKFVVHSFAFITFLLLIVVCTAESSDIITKNNTISSRYPVVFTRYEVLRNMSPAYEYGRDIPIRQDWPTTTELLISLWIIGFMYNECTQLLDEGLCVYCASMYNLVDFALILVYIGSFTLKYMVMFKVHIALEYFLTSSLPQITGDHEYSQYSLYWITADRYFWDTWDPINIAEGLFAIANILSFSRISYLLPANESLGPLQISLGRMIKDILKFLALFLVVLIAFMIGLQNLFWYYNVREEIEVEKRNFTVPAQQYFGDSMATFRTVFWSIFGRGEPSVVTLNDYDNHVTEDVGYVIYGAYNVATVTVLLNMLIAMMARSFQQITEESDVEWKFARSQLYMDYIGTDLVLPVPLNLARIPRAFCELIFECCCCQKEDEEEQEDVEVTMNNTTSTTHVRNGVEPMQTSSAVDLSAVDIYEGNATQAEMRKTLRRHKSLGFSETRSKSYQKVMQRIIQRYIFDIQREAEVTEDDFEEIKQDISSFRYEMLNVMKTRETQFNDMIAAMKRISGEVQTLQSGTVGGKTKLQSQGSVTEDESDSVKEPEEKGSQKLISKFVDRLKADRLPGYQEETEETHSEHVDVHESIGNGKTT